MINQEPLNGRVLYSISHCQTSVSKDAIMSLISEVLFVSGMSVSISQTKSLLKFGKEATSRFIRFITGHGFLRKQNAYVAHGTNEDIPFEETKCRMCGEAKEEPAHIIRECEAFCQERLEEFNFLEFPPDMKWTVNQMMRFLNKPRVRNLEEEEESDN